MLEVMERERRDPESPSITACKHLKDLHPSSLLASPSTYLPSLPSLPYLSCHLSSDFSLFLSIPFYFLASLFIPITSVAFPLLFHLLPCLLSTIVTCQHLRLYLPCVSLFLCTPSSPCFLSIPLP